MEKVRNTRNLRRNLRKVEVEDEFRFIVALLCNIRKLFWITRGVGKHLLLLPLSIHSSSGDVRPGSRQEASFLTGKI